MKGLTGLLELWSYGLKIRLGLILTVVLHRIQVYLASTQSNYSSWQTAGILFPCDRKNCSSIWHKANAYQSLCKRLLAKATGRSHCSVHTRKAIPGGCSHITDVGSKEARSYSGCFDYCSAEPKSTSGSRCPINPCYDFKLWKGSGCTIRSSQILFYHLRRLIFLVFFYFLRPCKSVLLDNC